MINQQPSIETIPCLQQASRSLATAYSTLRSSIPGSDPRVWRVWTRFWWKPQPKTCGKPLPSYLTPCKKFNVFGCFLIHPNRKENINLDELKTEFTQNSRNYIPTRNIFGSGLTGTNWASRGEPWQISLVSLPPFILNTPVQRNHGGCREFPHSIGTMQKRGV